MVTNQELERRWKLVRKVMERSRLDWLICGVGLPGGYARWLSNRSTVGTGTAMVMNGVAFPIEGDMYFFSHGDMVHSTPVDSYGVKHVVYPAQSTLMVDTTVPVVLDFIASSKPKKIGFLGMGSISAAAYELCRKGLPNTEFVDAADLIAPLKAVKSEEELVLMRRAAEMHDEAVAVVRKTVRPGITANDVVEEIRHFFVLAGSGLVVSRAGSAPAGSICRYDGPGARKMENGDQFAMLIECSEPDGYFSEMMPTVCIGKIPPELQKVFDDAVEAQHRMLEMAKPGADPMELLRASDTFLKGRGYPAEARLAGHGQGVDLVERPALSPLGETLKLQANMVVSLHPTAHGKNAWGYPVNQSFLLTADGPKVMTKTPQEVFVV